MVNQSAAKISDDRWLDPASGNDGESLPVVIIGAGPVGMAVLASLYAKGISKIIVYDTEDADPYNRVALSSVLAGEVLPDSIINKAALSVFDGELNVEHRRARITKVDANNRSVTDLNGHIQKYCCLVLATGSRPTIPAIPGISLNGVFAFRTLHDAQRLAARRLRSQHTVVIGGGLLGIETAFAMRKYNTEVTLIEHNKHLMFRQLDRESSALLEQELSASGVNLMCAAAVRMIVGTTTVNSIVLRDGSELMCDTVIFAVGIRANIGLASEAGLSVAKGIKVNDRMQTCDPLIYAVGECAEYEDEVYGIVAPGLEQAAIAVEHITERNKVEPELGDSYRRTVFATSLKLVGLSVFSMDALRYKDRRVAHYTFRAEGIYRRISILRGQIVGTISVGDWAQLLRIRELVALRGSIMPWQIWRFKENGDLWEANDSSSVKSWSDQAIICNCNGVRKADIDWAITSGCSTVQAISEKTAAGSTCGTCKPLLVQLLDSQENILQPVSRQKPLLIMSAALVAVLAIALLIPGVPYSSSVQCTVCLDLLWTESLYKQVSGFSLLFLTALATFLSFRKRLPKISFGKFDGWRVVHVSIGVCAIAVLLLHTGFRLGYNLNLYLSLIFLGLALAGSVLGTLISMEHRFDQAIARRVRAMGLWAHVILCWPLPALLGFHIFKTYYF